MATTGVKACGLVTTLLLLCVGCASSGTSEGRRHIFKAEGVAFLEEAESSAQAFSSEWNTVVEATAQGLPAANATTPGQKRLTALEAAKFRALAKLAENIRGIHVSQVTKVQDMVFAGERVEGQTSGELAGVRIVDSVYNEDGEIAQVTVRVALDSKGNVIPEKIMPMAPLSLEARRARTEAAARINAVAALREQIGDAYVGQEVQVKNLVFADQRAWVMVNGMMQGVRFSEPEWRTRNKCVVAATIAVTEQELQKLQSIIARPAEAAEQN